MVSNSPMIAGWSWSPLIYKAFERSRDRISPIPSYFFGLITPSPKQTDTLPVLALHFRRGDYSDHCINMAGWGSTYTGQNSFPEFEERDKFVVPQVVEGYHQRQSNNSDLGSSTLQQPGDGDDDDDTLIVSSQDERVKHYMKHCYPDIGQVVERVRHVLHDYELFVRDRNSKLSWGSQKYESWGSTRQQQQTKEKEKKNWSAAAAAAGGQRRRESVGNKVLKRIYIMSNGDRQLLRELKQALIDDAGRSRLSSNANGGGGEGETMNDWEFEWTWDGVVTSRDLELGWEEKPVGQALDMYIGQRSELFIGNGVSNFSFFWFGKVN